MMQEINITQEIVYLIRMFLLLTFIYSFIGGPVGGILSFLSTD